MRADIQISDGKKGIYMVYGPYSMVYYLKYGFCRERVTAVS